MKTPFARRVAVIAAGVIVPLMASAGPAVAGLKPDDGQQHGPSLGVGGTLLLFVVIPLGAFLVIAVLSVLPSALSKPRYRPGKPWDQAPVWVTQPPAGAAPSSGQEGTRGGASAEW